MRLILLLHQHRNTAIDHYKILLANNYATTPPDYSKHRHSNNVSKMNESIRGRQLRHHYSAPGQLGVHADREARGRAPWSPMNDLIPTPTLYVSPSRRAAATRRGANLAHPATIRQASLVRSAAASCHGSPMRQASPVRRESYGRYAAPTRNATPIRGEPTGRYAAYAAPTSTPSPARPTASASHYASQYPQQYGSQQQRYGGQQQRYGGQQQQQYRDQQPQGYTSRAQPYGRGYATRTEAVTPQRQSAWSQGYGTRGSGGAMFADGPLGPAGNVGGVRAGTARYSRDYSSQPLYSSRRQGGYTSRPSRLGYRRSAYEDDSEDDSGDDWGYGRY